MAFNVVELMDHSDDGGDAFDQPCRFGHRCGGHAVYCHNDNWDDSPHKCRRSWSSGGKVKDEDCPGFQPNPAYTGQLSPTTLTQPLCAECGGAKLVQADRGKMETCGRCMGDGTDPMAVAMSQFAQDTLEICCTMTGKSPAQFENNVRVAETDEESKAVWMLDELRLIQVQSITHARGATVFLYQMTPKGDAVMRANWAATKDPSTAQLA